MSIGCVKPSALKTKSLFTQLSLCIKRRRYSPRYHSYLTNKRPLVFCQSTKLLANGRTRPNLLDKISLGWKLQDEPNIFTLLPCTKRQLSKKACTFYFPSLSICYVFYTICFNLSIVIFIFVICFFRNIY